jgi:hypothetical protein
VEASIVSANTIDAIINVDCDSNMVARGQCFNAPHAINDDLQNLKRLDMQLQLARVEL